jgi:apolipoprotein N-acyltransferase
LAQAQLRAIEEGLPIIRATPNGISAVISPQGKILHQIARKRAGVIDTNLPAALPPTLFSRLGLWASGIVGLLLAGVGLGVSWDVMPIPRAGAGVKAATCHVSR